MTGAEDSVQAASVIVAVVTLVTAMVNAYAAWKTTRQNAGVREAVLGRSHGSDQTLTTLAASVSELSTSISERFLTAQQQMDVLLGILRRFLEPGSPSEEGQSES